MVYFIFDQLIKFLEVSIKFWFTHFPFSFVVNIQSQSIKEKMKQGQQGKDNEPD